MKTPVFSRSIVTIVLLLFVCTSAFPQTISEKAKKEAEQARELRRKSYVLVDEIANGAQGLKLPDNRAMMLAEAAELLWEHDENRARNLFWDAYQTIGLMQQPGDDSGDKKKRASVALAIFSLRRKLLIKTARHDHRLARR